MFRLILGLAAFAATVPALAETPDQAVTQIAVGYGDLDLSTAAGVATLNRRIKAAVHTVCGDADFRDARSMSVIRRCRQAATNEARVQTQLVLAAQPAKSAKLSSR